MYETIPINSCVLFLFLMMNLTILKSITTAYSVTIPFEARFQKCKEKGNQDKQLSHPDDCGKFVACTNGIPVVMACPTTLVYNEEQVKCVERGSEDDKCTPYHADRECELLRAKDPNAEILFPHPTICHRYFDCSNDTSHHRYSPFQEYEMECPYPTLWDVKRKTCLDYEQAKCGKNRVASTWMCDYLSFSCDGPNCRPCYIHHPSCVGVKDGLWPNSINLWTPQYVQCLSQRTTTTQCPRETRTKTEQAFHPVDRKCVPLWMVPQRFGGLEPMCGSNPPGYYQLDELDVITYACPGEVIFYCKLPYPGHRDISRCEILLEETHKCEDGHWPVFTKLWSTYYKECKDSKYGDKDIPCPIKMGVPQVFHPGLRKCLSPWFIPPENGGIKPNCDSKLPGDYSIPGHANLLYRCPGEDLLLCRPDLDAKDDPDMEALFQNTSLLIQAKGNKKTSECVFINNHKTNTSEICAGKVPDSMWPVPDKQWTSRYVLCAKDGGQELRCKFVEEIEQIFHPFKRECIPRYELTPLNGGYVTNCDCKPDGLYSYGAFMYKCPWELKYICKPPMYSKIHGIRNCKPLKKKVQDNQ